MLAAAPDTPPSAPEGKRAAFAAIASEERAMRRKAAKSFPTDPWSQDDDFHKQERDRAKAYADDKRLRFDDVLSALDEGMRGDWPRDRRVSLRATVPPCQPRTIY